jgi:hypothetical protein
MVTLTFATASLKLNEGNEAQTQAVLTELKRIQQYFGKIKNIESPPEPETRTLTINQEATARILKADLVCSGEAITDPRLTFYRATTKQSAVSLPKRLQRNEPRHCSSLLRTESGQQRSRPFHLSLTLLLMEKIRTRRSRRRTKRTSRKTELQSRIMMLTGQMVGKRTEVWRQLLMVEFRACGFRWRLTMIPRLCQANRWLGTYTAPLKS